MIRTLTFAAGLALLGFASSANAYPAADGVAAKAASAQPAGKILLVRHGADDPAGDDRGGRGRGGNGRGGHDDGPNHA
jgi:hypothetical protein